MCKVLVNSITTFEPNNNYVYEYDPWKGIIVLSAFDIHNKIHIDNKQFPVQLVSGQYMIVPIDNVAN